MLICVVCSSSKYPAPCIILLSGFISRSRKQDLKHFRKLRMVADRHTKTMVVVKLPAMLERHASNAQFTVMKVEVKDVEYHPAVSKRPWKESDPKLSPRLFWKKPAHNVSS